MDDEGTIYLALDVRPVQFGNALGELNRTGWTITGSEELDADRHPFPLDAPLRAVGWQRIYAQRALGDHPIHLGL